MHSKHNLRTKAQLPVSALQLSVDEGRFEVENVGVFHGGLLWHIRQTVPDPGVGLPQGE